MDTQAIEVDKLAAFRELAAAEQAEKSERGKMSEAAKAKLRAINERDRANVDADAALTTEFNSRPWSVEQLTDFLAKSFGGHSFTLRRRGQGSMAHRAGDEGLSDSRCQLSRRTSPRRGGHPNGEVSGEVPTAGRRYRRPRFDRSLRGQKDPPMSVGCQVHLDQTA